MKSSIRSSGNPAGITAVVNKIKGFSKRKVTERRVRAWFDEHKSEPKYYKPLKYPSGNEGSWLNSVNGAVFLKDLFTNLSGGSVVYNKTEHSPMLTEWTLRNAPNDLLEISELIAGAITNVALEPGTRTS